MRLTLSALLLTVAIVSVPLAAQGLVQPIPGTTDADRLAAQMRLLAGNPNDISALLAAGELSLKLDDLGAAASFFARAEKVDPHNGRAKAGEASILVHAERPGEALRYFALAESYGLAPATFAADRGLAYDLIGEQERAQRDYRLALRTSSAAGPDEEVQRRYALSLAIAGKRDLADQQLQPLLRKSDRGAWRARAFILALGGNVAEASRIATTMMPPGTAAGLQPFLERLPTLGPVDRAFAVHFGEVRSTPQRLADARMVPTLPALGADPYAPRLATASTPPAPADKGKRRGKDKKRETMEVAVATPAPMPLPQAPGYRGSAAAAPVAVATRGTVPAAWPSAAPATTAPRAGVTVAASQVGPAAASRVTTMSGIVPATQPTAWPGPPATAALRSVPVASPRVTLQPSVPLPYARATPATSTGVAAIVPTAGVSRSAPPPETNVFVAAVTPPATDHLPSAVTSPPAAAPLTFIAPASQPPVATLPAPLPVPASSGAAFPAVTQVATAEPPRSSPATISTGTPLPPESATPPVVPAAVAARPPRDDSALSRIVASLPIPAAELGIGAPVRPPPTPPAQPDADSRAAQAAQAAADKAAAEKADRAAAAKALADKRAADRKAAAEKKALAEKKAAAEQKTEEAREAAAQKKLERANPERIWVQVAGGAFEGDLPKAWAAAKAKGGDAFAGHASGWTTPLRATNRVLAGPFKTDAEARAFVNKLKGEGMSSFTFTSEAGQVVTKLPTK